MAAGVAALLVAHYPDATAFEIEAALVASTRPAPFASPDANGHDLQYGYGIIDPAAALRLLAPVPVEPEPEPAAEVGPEEDVTEPTEPEVVEEEDEVEPEAEVVEPEPDIVADSDEAETDETTTEVDGKPGVKGGGCVGGEDGGAAALLLAAYALRKRRQGVTR